MGKLVSLLASMEVTHCLEWFSLTVQGGSLGLDALFQDWLTVPLILQVLQSQGGLLHSSVGAPCWSGRPWFV